MTDARMLPGRPRGGEIAGQATPRAYCVLAPNPSPMTLDGTNTWIVAEPDSDLAVVIDPGPQDEGHLAEVVATAERLGKRVALTLLTHGHPDHAEGAARFAELTGTKVRALDPALRLGDEGLTPGNVVRVGGLELLVVSTPGHTADSLCFQLAADRAVLTGDTVLGRGTTVVAHPDGRLGDYLDSLRRLRSLAVDDGVTTVLPGHGPVLGDAQGAVEYYLAHRANRLAQVETAVENGHRTPAEVVAHVYADVDPALWPAAELSVRAQLEYLREHGLI
ncbi:MBL fold metallo-hydrolase [Streptomyces sp. NPDC051940]|uniref:MBL fold metallo-hydrolase n=1 Tax=Streptomyces sp. NPDC051940 TaxID=3155675 RepID=UPI00342FE2AF